MQKLLRSIVLPSLTVASLLGQQALAQSTKATEAEAKMFAVSAGYERFMGRWSRLLAPTYIAFAGVKNGDRVLDVGTGTGSLAAALEAGMPASEIVVRILRRGLSPTHRRTSRLPARTSKSAMPRR